MHSRPRAISLAALGLVVVVLDGCSPAGADPLASFDGASLTIDARDLTFDPVIVTMPAGQPLRLILNNHDAGVGHNLHVFQADTEFGHTSTVIGPGLAAVELAAMPPGRYQFECTIHPDMIGTIVVAVGATPGPSPGDEATPPDDTTPPDVGSPSPDASNSPHGSTTARASKAPRETRAPNATSSGG